jgi:serine/threonine-protein kinase
LTGTHLGHYIVREELGRGGMGVVYVAEDTRLERRVALKLLRPEVTESADRRARFQREAKAAAALNHPNIVHLYSVDESDHQLFLTMELVEGRSLREILSTGVPLPLARFLAFSLQLAEGLASAHAAGILHRDLEPANVMITGDDRVKILDFGLAKLLTTTAGWDRETMVEESGGMALGTIGYMSPEQALGKTLDARSDLFSLGVVLFEMATGRAPFVGATPAAVLDQLLNQRPSSPHVLNPGLPASLSGVIERAMEKDPANRHGSALELLDDLKRIDPAEPIGPASRPVAAQARMPSSIVVLPFVDMSAERDQEYFCHGVTDEIINTLTSVPGLRVISRTSAFAFQGQHLDVTEIGRRLRVGAALEGSVRKAGERVRVNAQLVNAEDGCQLWSKRFDRNLSDVFAIQDEIAGTIVNELQHGLPEAARGKRGPLDLEAHDAYLKGMYALHKWSDSSMKQAIAGLREAIEHDPGFAPAYIALAEGYIWLYSGLGIRPASETVPQARWAADTALKLDPTLSDGHRLRALIAMNHDWDRRGAADALSRALHFGPGSAAAHLWNAWRLSLLENRHDEALGELEEAERLDPLDLQLKTQIGYVHHFRHDLDRAIGQFDKVVALDPSFAFAHYGLGDAWTQRGQYERAIGEYHKAIELGGRSANHVGALGYAYGLSGNGDRARALLHELDARAAGSYVSPMWPAMIQLGLSDVESLFQSLNRAFEERDGSLILITTALEFDPVREDERFKSLLDRMGLGHLTTASDGI